MPLSYSSDTKIEDIYELAAAAGKVKARSSWTDIFTRFSRWREELDLPNPGTVESAQKEVKNTLLTGYAFDGGRADLTKSLSINPVFQITHSFALGSQSSDPSYSFVALYMNKKHFMQGSLDHDGGVNARYNYGWTPNSITKFQGQFSSHVGHNMLSVEHEITGRDYSVNFKGVNPSPIDLTGVYIGSYLQSITRNLALGIESLYQRPTPQMTEFNTSYLAKYTSSHKDWIATAQIQPAGIMQATYWQRLSEKVDVAADLQVIATPSRRDAIATLGAKYDLRMAVFRAQLDSTGKVSAFLEQRFMPTFSFLVSGELDHLRNHAKFGVGVMIESSSLTMEEMEAQGLGP